MAAPLRNGVFLKHLVSKGIIAKTVDTHGAVKLIPLTCQNARQFSTLHRLNRLRHTVIRGQRYKKLYSVAIVRHASSSNQTPGDIPAVYGQRDIPSGYGGSDIPPGYIPDVPDVPELQAWDKVPELAELNALGEPTLQSIGLGSNYPSGLVQQGLEMLHVNLDIPWWATISLTVVIVRMCMFPLIIKQRKTLIRYNNIMPEVQKIQAEMADAQAATDYMEAQRAATQIKTLMTKNDVYLRNIFLPIMCQIPVFMSVFFGLRKMAEYPVLSMQTGGCLWFENLTVVDPTVMLPVITAATLWLNLEIGAESVKTQSTANQPLTKAIMRVMPLITLVATMNFPAAMCVYWASSNFFTLAQVMFLKIPAVRIALGIPVEKTHKGDNQPMRKTRIGKRLKDAYRTTQKLTEAQNRKTVDGTTFKDELMEPPERKAAETLTRSSDELMQEGWKEEVVRPTQTISDKIKQDKAREQWAQVRQKQEKQKL